MGVGGSRLKVLLEQIAWELSSTLRPPILEVLVALLTFSQVLNALFACRYVTELQGLVCPIDIVSLEAARAFGWGLAQSIGFSFPTTTLICSIVPAISLARDLETGRVGEELSLPIGRSVVFLSKFAAVVIVLAAVNIASSAAAALVVGPWALGGIPFFLRAFPLCFVATILPLAAFSTAVAVASGNSLVTVLVGFIVPFSLYRLAGFDTLAKPCVALSGGLRSLHVSLAILSVNLVTSYVLFVKREVTQR